MPLSLDTYQRLLWDASPVGEKQLGVMYSGLMLAATQVFLPNANVSAAQRDVFKWTSLLLSSLDVPMTQSLEIAEKYIERKFGNRTLTLIATRVLDAWMTTRASDEPTLSDEQRTEIVYHLSGMVVVLAAILHSNGQNLSDIYSQLLDE